MRERCCWTYSHLYTHGCIWSRTQNQITAESHLFLPNFWETPDTDPPFQAGGKKSRLHSNDQKTGMSKFLQENQGAILFPCPDVAVVVKPEGNPSILGWDPNQPYFACKGSGNSVLVPASTTFQQCFFFLWGASPSLPPYLSINSASSLLLHTWTYQNVFLLWSSISLLSTPPTYS